MKLIETPGQSTCEDVSKFLDVNIQHTLKSLVFKASIEDEEKVVIAVLIGDDTINEIKLKNYLKASHLCLATDNELEAIGLIKGFIGPVNLGEVRIIFDDQITPIVVI